MKVPKLCVKGEASFADAKLGSVVKMRKVHLECTWKWAPRECHWERNTPETGIQSLKYVSASGPVFLYYFHNSKWRNGYSFTV